MARGQRTSSGKNFSETFIAHPPRFLAWVPNNFYHRPKPKLSPQLEQFLKLFDHSRHEKWHLLLDSGDSTHLQFGINGGKSCPLWAGFQYSDVSLSTSHPEWRVLQAISVFARKTTKVNLVEQLRLISDADPTGNSVWISWFCPWQIGICLTARSDGLTWEDIISSVEAGNIGAEGDWTRWEEENKGGINLSQFRFDESMTVSHSLQGRLLRSSILWLSHMPEGLRRECGSTIINGLVQWPDLIRNERFMNFCSYGLLDDWFDLSTIPELIGRIIKICSEQELALQTPVLAAALLQPATLTDKRHLLAQGGTCLIQPGGLFDEWEGKTQKANEILESILQELPGCDEWGNLLRAISFLPPLEAMQGISETFLEQLRLIDEKFAKAASILRLNALRWTASEAAEVVREALALRRDYPNHFKLLLSFMESGGKSGPHLEAFLVEMLKQRPLDLEPELVTRAADLLVKLVERRPATTKLPDPAIHQAARQTV
jgi:hypothetical protein